MNKIKSFYYCCKPFKQAIVNGFIKAPGERIPHRQTYSTKYFIIKQDELRKTTPHRYITHCPFCGEKLNNEE